MCRYPMLLVAGLALAGCGQDEESGNTTAPTAAQASRLPTALQVFEPNTAIMARRPPPNPERNAYYGDLHVHTEYSFDAFSFGSMATPRDAYRYAKGEAIRHPVGYDIQLSRPLDFYAVTDHAMFLGVAKEVADAGTTLGQLPFAADIHGLNDPDNHGIGTFTMRGSVPGTIATGIIDAIDAGVIGQQDVDAVSKSAWRDTIEAADEANVPGRFTAFAGYEYTSSTDERGNLHRNVIFRDTDRLPELPFSRLNSRNPEGLWDWMDDLRARGVESLAIPHNSNGSNGSMFERVDWSDAPIDEAYASRRMRNEPLVEVTQVKGTSETHPLLSDTDEWAGFEIAPHRVATKLPSQPQGSYVREAYRTGLELSADGMTNPYAFGLVGATDTHIGGGADDEATYFSKVGLIDGTPERRGSVPAGTLLGAGLSMLAPGVVTEVEGRTYLQFSSFEFWGAAGVTGVWAEENTREAIYAAFRRKETFATSGPRIRLRFFAGYGLDAALLEAPDGVRRAYADGVTMGADLPANGGRAPRFWVWATADPQTVPLQRVQVVKGWMADGTSHEQVFDVACSDGLAVDPATHRCPDNGAKVNLADCSADVSVGAAELNTVWQDPTFDADQEAFYYVRALENPTCRWSTWDALRAGVEPRSDLPTTVVERAWSSPIWYRAGAS